jgi:NAD/NADP transhydrogenase beta subunit
MEGLWPSAYAGVDNPHLFYDAGKTVILFCDNRQGLQDVK